MIYKIYEKFIEITENYKILDYLTYLIFVLFVTYCSLAVVVYSAGEFSVTGSGLKYSVTADESDGHIPLPIMSVKCESDNSLSLAIDVEVSGYEPEQFLDVSITEGESKDSKHYLIRLPKDGNPQTINYGQDLSEWASLFRFSYDTEWRLNIHGKLLKGMSVNFTNFNAYSDAGPCSLVWQIENKN